MLANLALWLPSAAFAVDLDVLVEAWTVQVDGSGGSDHVDEARGVVLTSAGHVLAVGWRDGLPDHGHDGYAVEYAPSGVPVWEWVDDVGAVGPDRASSEDRLYAVAIEPTTDDVAFCGGRGPEDANDPDVRYLVEARTANPPYVPTVDWSLLYVDGSTSPIQECRAVSWLGGYVYAAGWADSGNEDGRWYGVKLDEGSGLVIVPPGPIVYDDQAWIAAPDQALGVAVSSTTGAFALVGTRGFSGLEGSVLNDIDWHVRAFDAKGVLAWEDTYAGDALLDDRALAAAIHPVTGDVYVAGWTNVGLDNAGQANLDWMVVRYEAEGDAYGGPQIVWTRTWESEPGASEGATAIQFDENLDLLVGGWAIDPKTGRERWRVAKLETAFGDVIEEWLGPVHGGNARIHDLDARDGRLAMAGFVDAGKGAAADFAVAFLDFDDDGDGTADAVDACPEDPEKAADTGVCGCGVADIDTDYDGALNCVEDCPADPEKTEPGVCGCGEPDVDDDGDLTPNCNDDCPQDPNKTTWGVCGCGAPDTDSDEDGVLGCDDACSNTPPGTTVDEFGCPVEEDTGGPGTGTTDGGGSDAGKGGCGCASGAPSAGAGALALALLAGLRRKRRL